MSEDKNMQLIELYLSGMLDPEEMQEVEARIAIDEDFAAEIDLTRQIMLTMQDRELIDFHQRISEAWDRAVPTPRTEAEPDPCSEPVVPPVPKTSARSIYWVAGAAVAVLAFVIIVVRPSFLFSALPPSELIEKDTPNDKEREGTAKINQEEKSAEAERDAEGKEPNVIFSDSLTNPQPEGGDKNTLAVAYQFYEYPEFSSTTRTGERIGSANTLTQAQAAFESKDYNEALRLLSGIADKNRNALYLEGHTYFCLKNFAKASGSFNTLRGPGQYLGDKADWFYALSRLAEKDASDQLFSSALNAIIQEPKHEFHTQALALRKSLQVR